MEAILNGKFRVMAKEIYGDPLNNFEKFENCTHKCYILNYCNPSKFWVRQICGAIKYQVDEMEMLMGVLYAAVLDETIKACDLEVPYMRFLLNEIREPLELDLYEDEINQFIADMRTVFGDYAVVKMGDKFYRVLIIRYEGEARYCVCYAIDYGRYFKVPFTMLLPFSHRFISYPAFAIRCCLSDIYPFGSKSGKPMADWSPQAIEMFESLLEYNSEWTLTIKSKNSSHLSGFFPITLHCDSWLDTVNDMMINLKGAISLEVPPLMHPLDSKYLNDYKESLRSAVVPKEHNINSNKLDVVNDLMSSALNKENANNSINEFKQDLANFNPMEEAFHSSSNDPGVNQDDPAQWIYGYVDKAHNRRCPFFAKNGRCFKGETCRMEHTLEDPLGFTTDKLPCYIEAFEDLPRTVINEIYEVFSIKLTANALYIVLKRDITMYRKKLISLNKSLNEAKNIRQMKKMTVPPIEMELVIVVDNGTFYRARCLDANPEDDLYEVLLVDDGHILEVEGKCLREMEGRYLEVPLMARRCLLADIRIRNSWLSLFCELVERIRREAGKIEIKVRGNYEVTQLWIDLIMCGEDVGALLVKKKFAVFERDYFPINSYSLVYPG